MMYDYMERQVMSTQMNYETKNFLQPKAKKYSPEHISMRTRLYSVTNCSPISPIYPLVKIKKKLVDQKQ